MKNFLALFLARNREFYRDKGSLSWSLLFPLLLIFGLSFALSNDRYLYRVGVLGDMGRYAHADNLLSQSARFYLEREEAEAIVTEMEQRIGGAWYETARREGVSERDCETIRTAFVYPGFRLKL